MTLSLEDCMIDFERASIVAVEQAQRMVRSIRTSQFPKIKGEDLRQHSSDHVVLNLLQDKDANQWAQVFYAFLMSDIGTWNQRLSSVEQEVTGCLQLFEESLKYEHKTGDTSTYYYLLRNFTPSKIRQRLEETVGMMERLQSGFELSASKPSALKTKTP